MTTEEKRYCDLWHKWYFKLEEKHQNDVISEILEMEDKIRDLEAQVNSLSDILAKKDHEIFDLKAGLKMANSIINGIAEAPDSSHEEHA